MANTHSSKKFHVLAQGPWMHALKCVLAMSVALIVDELAFGKMTIKKKRIFSIPGKDTARCGDGVRGPVLHHAVPAGQPQR
jgi:hypothetical protein